MYLKLCGYTSSFYIIVFDLLLFVKVLNQIAIMETKSYHLINNQSNCTDDCLNAFLYPCSAED